MSVRIQNLGDSYYRIWQDAVDIGDVQKTKHGNWLLARAVDGAPVSERQRFDTRREAVAWAIENRLYGAKS